MSATGSAISSHSASRRDDEVRLSSSGTSGEDDGVHATLAFNSVQAISALMEVGEDAEFAPAVPRIPIERNTVNIAVTDNSASAQLSYLRIRRPMSVAMANLFCDMFVEPVVGAKLFSPDAVTSSSYYLLVEIEQAFLVAGRDVPPRVTRLIRKFQKGGRRDRTLKREFAATILPAAVEHGREVDAIPTVHVPFSRARFAEMDQMCRRVFGERLGLSVLLAPLYWLSRHTLRHCGSMVDHLVQLGVERG